MNIYLEIFGYIGTALVIVSMMMTSLIKLRIINMCGGLISLVYAVFCNTWPVVVLNACLICINFVQTVRQLRGKEEVTLLSVEANDPIAQHLMRLWQKDIEKYQPDCNLYATEETERHILYVGQQAVGVLFGSKNEDLFSLQILYLVPSHRTAVMGKNVLQALRARGIHTLTSSEFYAKEPYRYLRRLGFTVCDGLLAKQI